MKLGKPAIQVLLATMSWILLVAMVSCSSSDRLHELRGRVTYQGQPLKEGSLRLVPIKGTNGPANVGQISEGQYAITARGGVPDGVFRVEVKAYEPIPGAKPYTEQQADGQRGVKAGDLPKQQVLPDKYNRMSTLEVTVDSSGGATTKDFDLH